MLTRLRPQVILLLAIGHLTLGPSLQDANRAVISERCQLLFGFAIPKIEAGAEIKNVCPGIDRFDSRRQANVRLPSPAVNNLDFASYGHGELPEWIAIK